MRTFEIVRWNNSKLELILIQASNVAEALSQSSGGLYDWQVISVIEKPSVLRNENV